MVILAACGGTTWGALSLICVVRTAEMILVEPDPDDVAMLRIKGYTWAACTILALVVIGITRSCILN